MNIKYFLGFIIFQVIYCSCSNELENQLFVCGNPTSEAFIVGEIDSKCTMSEANDGWDCTPHNISRSDCSLYVGSDLVNRSLQQGYRILIKIPFNNKPDCLEISPDLITKGKYNINVNDENIDFGEAVFQIDYGAGILSSSEIEQDSDAYFEILTVDDIPQQDGWLQSTYFRKVTGKVSCRVKAVYSTEGPIIDVNNVYFSVYMAY